MLKISRVKSISPLFVLMFKFVYGHLRACLKRGPEGPELEG